MLQWFPFACFLVNREQTSPQPRAYSSIEQADIGRKYHEREANDITIRGTRNEIKVNGYYWKRKENNCITRKAWDKLPGGCRSKAVWGKFTVICTGCKPIETEIIIIIIIIIIIVVTQKEKWKLFNVSGLI